MESRNPIVDVTAQVATIGNYHRDVGVIYKSEAVTAETVADVHRGRLLDLIRQLVARVLDWREAEIQHTQAVQYGYDIKDAADRYNAAYRALCASVGISVEDKLLDVSADGHFCGHKEEIVRLRDKLLAVEACFAALANTFMTPCSDAILNAQMDTVHVSGAWQQLNGADSTELSNIQKIWIQLASFLRKRQESAAYFATNDKVIYQWIWGNNSTHDEFISTRAFIIGGYNSSATVIGALITEAKRDFTFLKDDDIEVGRIKDHSSMKSYVLVSFSLPKDTKRDGYRLGGPRIPFNW